MTKTQGSSSKRPARCQSRIVTKGPFPRAGDPVAFTDKRMAPVPGTLRRRVEMVNAAQTNHILFGEWSYDIRGESVSQLTEVGEALKESFARNERCRGY